ncbi:hypothetical protein [Stigmatella aurantiaca]|uniref:Uncharacterized protein n=1 Tax=Stigmatella aurantiaca (strain DW4/3-1) TaxID=378806 RepID=Q090M1_STIAD|nr:hypothetical protein [Stigmatella aurantiaca]ADO73473.1 uncharacterized protein STAUR_5711 [Stigmatella aurantiaca DW4/3-1]EAU66186.1 hypothetical protein STIAU_5298 [Stigmatella aurantiaca DW4/3-1]
MTINRPNRKSQGVPPQQPVETKSGDSPTPQSTLPTPEAQPLLPSQADTFQPTALEPQQALSLPSTPSAPQQVDPNGRAEDARTGAEAAARLLVPDNYPTAEWESIRGSDFLSTVAQHQDDPAFLADLYKALGPANTAKMLENAERAATTREELDTAARSLGTAFASGQFSVAEQRMFGEQAARDVSTALSVAQVLGSPASAPGVDEMRRGFLDVAMKPGKALGTGREAGKWARAAGEALAGDTSGRAMREYVGRMTEGERTGFFEKGIRQGPSWGDRSLEMPYNGLEEVMRQASLEGLLPASLEPLRVPNDAELIGRLNALRGEKLTPEQEADIRDLSSPEERRMFLATVRQLEAVKAGSLTPSQYMTNVMQAAADIAGTDGKQFAHLVHFAFNEPLNTYVNERVRGILGGGNIPAGSLLETTFKELDGDRNSAKGGFNPNITDTDPSSTVTHHFAEFLAVGSSTTFNVSPLDAFDNPAVEHIDDKTINPGDVRSGYFGVMLGNALKGGKVTPQQAVDLYRWAYTQPPSTMQPPPWGTQDTGTYLDPSKDYDITQWMQMYAEAAQ